MPTLTLKYEDKEIKLAFDGTPLLSEVLEKAGYAVFSPCGGAGKCGKCAVRLTGAVSEWSEAEIRHGHRLACRAVLLGDATAQLTANEREYAYIESKTETVCGGAEGFCAAVDVGTTTVVLKLFDKEGRCIGEASALSPQRSCAADVMGRIDAALSGKGELLKAQITSCIEGLLGRGAEMGGITKEEVRNMVITGNTAMMYLLTGREPSSIARAPFKADHSFGEWVELFGRRVYLPPIINAFVGADLTCAVIASGMCDRSDTALLCDIGTNGEMALWKEGKLYVTSAAAGPAFEGAEISCGCGLIPGAVDKVWLENGRIAFRTVGGKDAVGICGSGLIDAVAAFLELEMIESNGAVSEPLTLAGLRLSGDDVRSFQLAKAAVCAGIKTLLKRSHTSENEVKALYLAGGFGNHLDMRSVATVGLIPRALTRKAKPIGNAALSGAAALLFDEGLMTRVQKVADCAIHVDLGGREDFNTAFIENMMF